MNRKEVRAMIREELDSYGEWVALRIVLAVIDPIVRALSRGLKPEEADEILDKIRVQHKEQVAERDKEEQEAERKAEEWRIEKAAGEDL